MGCTSAFPLPLIQKSNTSIDEKDGWVKNRNKTCKNKTKIFQGSKDINRSGTLSSKQN